MNAEELIRDVVRLWAPPPQLTVSEWADRFRYLSSESAAEHGKWLTLPFQREPFDSISDPRVYRTVIKSATQMLKTVAIENGIGYFSHQDPGPILVLQPRDADAKAFSKERIAPMIRDTPVLRNIYADSKSRVSNNTIEEKLFPGGMLAITSAGSPGNLARRAIRFLFCDEVDKYPATAGSEGNPVSLARKRLSHISAPEKGDSDLLADVCRLGDRPQLRRIGPARVLRALPGMWPLSVVDA